MTRKLKAFNERRCKRVGFEYRKLRGRIIEMYGSQGRFAEILGVSEVTVSNKLRGITQFSQDDIVSWCEALKISYMDAGAYFFA